MARMADGRAPRICVSQRQGLSCPLASHPVPNMFVGSWSDLDFNLQVLRVAKKLNKYQVEDAVLMQNRMLNIFKHYIIHMTPPPKGTPFSQGSRGP